MGLFLLLLVVVPIAAHVWAQRHAPQHVGLVTGLTFGTIADPLSLAVYGLGFIVPPLLLPGLLLAQFHAVGWAKSHQPTTAKPQAVDAVKRQTVAALPIYGKPIGFELRNEKKFG
jgi:hypothetical protein